MKGDKINPDSLDPEAVLDQMLASKKQIVDEQCKNQLLVAERSQLLEQNRSLAQEARSIQEKMQIHMQSEAEKIRERAYE